MTDRHKLASETKRDVKRLDEHERKPAKLIGLIFYGGTLGLMFVVPLILGAYLGRWLDSHSPGYSVRWTVSLIILGIALGIYNVVRFIKDRV